MNLPLFLQIILTYQILDKDNSVKQIYKGTQVQVFEKVLTKVVRVKYYNIFYDTKQIEGHF